MPDNKKQHYVPIFYLKLFSVLNSDKYIKICLKQNGKVIQRASLIGQAQESYFYGEDLEREKWFSHIEGKTTPILKKIVETKTLPKNKSDDYYWIWLFILLQAYRTRANVDDFNNVVDTTLKTTMKFETQFKDFEFDKYFFTYDDAIEKSLDILLKSLPMMMDLQIKLIENVTSKELVTSDNPVSKYNQFLESRNYIYAHTGMLSKGLQIFYPLAPDLLLMMYDPKIYKVGNKKQFSKIAMSDQDIDFINILTCLHANKTLYSTDKVTNHQLEQILEKSKRFEKHKKLEIKQFEPVSLENNNESTLVQHHRTPYMIKLNLSFVKQTQHAKSYKLSGYVAEIRDERYR